MKYYILMQQKDNETIFRKTTSILRSDKLRSKGMKLIFVVMGRDLSFYNKEYQIETVTKEDLK